MLKNIRFPHFKIKKEDSISGEDLINLRKFYTPILNPQAVILYEYLRDLSFDIINEKGMHNFDSLSYLLNIDSKSLNEARILLESLSLLSTFIDNINHYTVFVLEKPLNALEFRGNKLLSNKLSKILGKQKFEQLLGTNKTSLKLMNSQLLEDVSASYNDVFNEEDELQEIKNAIDNAANVDHSLLGTTSEINVDIQNKLEMNTFEYPNPYEAILKTDPRYFYSQISTQIPPYKIIELIKESRESGMIDPCINLIFFYAYEVNGKINFNYVEKIILDLISKGITSFVALEKYLDNLIKVKNSNVISKKDLYKIAYIEELKYSNMAKDK